jgi:hypothetical protein
MKYQVLKNFIDKNSKKKHEEGSDYTPSSKKRGKELVDLGYLQEIEEPKKDDDK